MIRYIYDLAAERDSSGNNTCPELTADEDKLEDGYRIIGEL